MNTQYLGIDPGKTGALTLLDHVGGILWIEDMTDLSGPALGAWITDLLDTHKAYVVAIERVQGRSGQGGADKFSVHCGALQGAIGALGHRCELPTPTTWKKEYGLTKTDKKASRQRAAQLWPDHAGMFARAKDDGRAESALIAEWLRRQYEPITATRKVAA